MIPKENAIHYLFLCKYYREIPTYTIEHFKKLNLGFAEDAVRSRPISPQIQEWAEGVLNENSIE
jgi:hypothetical protein